VSTHGRCRRRGAVVACAAVLAACAPVHRPAVGASQTNAGAHRVAVEVWRGGDDGLTIRFGEALEAALNGSPVFFAVSITTPEATRLTIEHNLRSLGRGDNAKAAFLITLSTRDRVLMGAIPGQCRQRALESCAARVISRAEELFLNWKQQHP
jgi:hypothetical protein